MQICDRTKKRSAHSLFMRQTGSSEICCVRRNRSVKNRRRDILRRWNSPPAVMSDATGRLSGATIVSPRDSARKQKRSGESRDRDQGQTYTQAGQVATYISPQECGHQSKTACRGQLQKCRKNAQPVRTPRLDGSRARFCSGGASALAFAYAKRSRDKTRCRPPRWRRHQATPG
jgi:hypothetical protein